MHLTWIVDSYPSIYIVYTYMYTTVGLCIGTVTVVQKLQHFGKTLSLVCCCRTSSYMHAIACLVHHVGGHLSKSLESRSQGTASHA